MGRIIHWSIGVAFVLLLAPACSVLQPQNPTRFEQADFVDKSLDDALGMIAKATVDGGAPGAIVAIMRDDDVGIVSAGLSQKGTDRPMPTDHPLRIASISKVYTAAVALTLAAEGVLDLDSPIRDYLPADVIDGMPNGDAATVRQLLNHTSGIPDYYDARSYLFQDWKQPITLERMLPVAKRGKATGAPGEAFAYSNFGYVLLGEISERASGRDLGDLIRERILAPLAASDTVYNVKHPIAPSIHGYGTNFRPWSDTWVYWEHSGPDAGVMAPAEDVLRFIDALTSEDGAFAEIGDRMFEATVESGLRQRQGLGLHARTTSSGVELVGHSGDVFGYLSFVYARSDRDAVVFGHVNCDCEDLLVSMIGNVLRAEEAIDP